MIWTGTRVKNTTSGLTGTVTHVDAKGGVTVQRDNGTKVALTADQKARFLRKV